MPFVLTIYIGEELFLTLEMNIIWPKEILWRIQKVTNRALYSYAGCIFFFIFFLCHIILQ